VRSPSVLKVFNQVNKGKNKHPQDDIKGQVILFLEAIQPTLVASFSVDWEIFSLRLRVEAAPSVLSARRLKVQVFQKEN